jgi:hypothetical protein
MYKIIGRNKITGRELKWGLKTFIRMEAQAFVDVLNRGDPEAEYRIEKV